MKTDFLRFNNPFGDGGETAAALCHFPTGIPVLGKVWALPGRHGLCRRCMLLLFPPNQAESYGSQTPHSLTTHRKPQKGPPLTSGQGELSSTRAWFEPCVVLLPTEASPTMGEMLPCCPCSSPCPRRHRRHGPVAGSHLGASWRALAGAERGWRPPSQKGSMGKVEQAMSHFYCS